MAFKKIGSVTSTEFNEGYSNLTVVGSPTISDDGIMSNISGSNGLTLTQVLSGAEWEVTSPKFLYSNTYTSGESRIFNMGTTSSTGTGYLRTNILANGTVACNILTSDWNHSIVYKDINTGATSGTDYVQTKFVHTGGIYYIYYKVNSGSWTLANSATNSTNIATNGSVRIGFSANTSITYDIKEFCIKINGSPVYSPAPNKFTTSSHQTTSRNIYEV